MLTKQNALQIASQNGATSLLNSGNDYLRCINATSPLTLTSDAFTVTLNLDQTALANNFYNKTTADSTLYNKTETDVLVNSKQATLDIAAEAGAVSFLRGTTVKCLTTASPLTYTDVNDKNHRSKHLHCN